MAATRTSGMRYGIIDNSSRGLLAVWSHGQGEAGDGLHFGFFAFSERLLADRVPDLPLQEHLPTRGQIGLGDGDEDRKSTRLNSSHSQISYAVFCLKKKKKNQQQ